MTAHRLYLGRIGHHRDGPIRHGFTYPVFFLGMDVDALDGALCGPARWPWPFSLNAFNLLGLRHRDHGARDGSALGPWLRGVLAEAGIDRTACARITLHTFPRVLGLGFSPVSFWLCHDAAGLPRAVLAEVNNTFGEHHSYLIAHADGRAIAPGDTLEARKVFHVSPFFPVQGRYRFQVRAQPDRLQVRIRYRNSEGHGLIAYLQGAGRPFSSGALVAAFLRHPMQTLTVLSRIHWHALLLWRRGVRFHSKPEAPHQEISVERH